MQILKDLYQIGGSLCGLTWTNHDANYDDCNTYCIKTKEGLLLFDCGSGDTWEQIEANMRAWSLDPNEIKACFLTHPHLDHAGAAHILASRGVLLYAHAETAAAIASGDERCCGYLYHKVFTPCKVDNIIKGNDVINFHDLTVSAMHLPGHTKGCIAYCFTYQGLRIVVSGDVIGTLLDGYFGWSGSIDFDKKSYLSSLRRFAQVDSDLMLPGHGLIYCHQPRRRVEAALNEALIQWR
ncbi:MAG: MBL fold metallo-hydrolase [Clostridia bacterium]|nr:MBL fold metallo-hydrolase [Clostridia bacterium]